VGDGQYERRGSTAGEQHECDEEEEDEDKLEADSEYMFDERCLGACTAGSTWPRTSASSGTPSSKLQ
jgi:hypothetical protein